MSSLVTCNWQLCGNYGQLCQKARNFKGTPSQHFFISENVFPTHPLKSLCIFHPLGYPCKQPIQSKREREQSASIWYQSSDLEPTAWNPFLIAYLALLSTRDKEKESKRWALGKIEERNRPTPLPRARPSCRRNKQRRMQLAQSTQHKESELKN
ncbi:hypothetical protein ACFX1X_028066 [Malus domestica]